MKMDKEEKRALRAKKKEYKKKVVAKYGYMYYLRDKTWINIKNQNPSEDAAAWAKRLEFYGFSTDGVDLKTGDRHFAAPLVYEDALYHAQADAVEETPVEMAEEAIEEPVDELVAQDEIADEAVEETLAEQDALEEIAETDADEPASMEDEAAKAVSADAEDAVELTVEDEAEEIAEAVEETVVEETLEEAVEEAVAQTVAEVVEETVEDVKEDAEA